MTKEEICKLITTIEYGRMAQSDKVVLDYVVSTLYVQLKDKNPFNDEKKPFSYEKFWGVDISP